MTFQLRCWSEEYREAFVELNSDPEVSADLGGPLTRSASDAKFERYRDAWTRDGISRWAVVEARPEEGEQTLGEGRLLGYAGVIKRSDVEHPRGVHYEIGWRLCRDAWGRGLATESARRALQHAWTVLSVSEIVSYTAPDNRRSQSVMARLQLERDPARDFTARYQGRDWTGLVWVARRPLTCPAPR